jgi:membrane fusion protein (multidrug efflux system)
MFRRLCASHLSILAAIALFGPASAQQPAGQPPVAVQVAPVQLAAVVDTAAYVGTVVAIQQVELRARIEGFLSSVNFKEGSMLAAGTLAFEIEKAPYLAALDGAKAALASAEALEAAAAADLKLAELTYNRQSALIRSDAIAQATVDQAAANRDATAARVKQAQAQIAEAQAQIATAALNLSYTDVRSPIAGRIGKAQVTAGNLVSAGSGALATIIQTDPIRVVFSISDLGYLAMVRNLLPGIQGRPPQTSSLRPKLRLSDGTAYAHPGEVAFMDNAVDSSTGTIAVYADFPNPELRLLPGQYVDVTLETGEARQLPVVPASAVLEDQDGPYVFVLDNGNRAAIRRIKTGARVGTDWSVTAGLATGEVIIVAGIQKLRPGAIVAPQPAPPRG